MRASPGRQGRCRDCCSGGPARGGARRCRRGGLRWRGRGSRRRSPPALRRPALRARLLRFGPGRAVARRAGGEGRGGASVSAVAGPAGAVSAPGGFRGPGGGRERRARSGRVLAGTRGGRGRDTGCAAPGRAQSAGHRQVAGAREGSVAVARASAGGECGGGGGCLVPEGAPVAGGPRPAGSRESRTAAGGRRFRGAPPAGGAPRGGQLFGEMRVKWPILRPARASALP